MAAAGDRDMSDGEGEEEEDGDDGGASAALMWQIGQQCVLRDDLLNLRLLMGSGFDPSTWVDECGMTLVHWAAAHGSARCAAFILQLGPHLYAARNQWHDTPGDLALRKGHQAVAEICHVASTGERPQVPGERAHRVLTLSADGGATLSGAAPAAGPQ
eukprot:TRINITY_DN12196_c0_g1_i1.p2 TRINITY_DN12196_c0_g1~~TRINITY_DN12196_c0_g1_i1.p2  ORF type:complete len:177 (+),score=67.90 TRINITY_DN12196_c0_g1_i1:60-533(+)